MSWSDTPTPTTRAICPHCGRITSADTDAEDALFDCPACHHCWAHTPYAV